MRVLIESSMSNPPTSQDVCAMLSKLLNALQTLFGGVCSKITCSRDLSVYESIKQIHVFKIVFFTK